MIVIVDWRGDVRSQVHYIGPRENYIALGHICLWSGTQPISGQIKLYWEHSSRYTGRHEQGMLQTIQQATGKKCDNLCRKSYWSVQFISSSNALHRSHCHYCNSAFILYKRNFCTQLSYLIFSFNPRGSKVLSNHVPSYFLLCSLSVYTALVFELDIIEQKVCFCCILLYSINDWWIMLHIICLHNDSTTTIFQIKIVTFSSQRSC